jgi:hypothetical protein
MRFRLYIGDGCQQISDNFGTLFFGRSLDILQSLLDLFSSFFLGFGVGTRML